MEQLLDRLIGDETLVEFDRHWFELLARMDPEAPASLLLTAALARRSVDFGHVCLNLENPALWWPSPAVDAGYCIPETRELIAWLESSPLAGTNPDLEAKPLLRKGNRLYLWRYFRYEQRLAEEVAQRISFTDNPEAEVMGQRLAQLAAATGTHLDNTQQAAVLTALSSRLTVITGGPGTGKTTIVFFILSLATGLKPGVSDQRRPQLAASSPAWKGRDFKSLPDHDDHIRQGGGLPRILLLAPTGKAAARLGEAIEEKRGLCDRTGGALAAEGQGNSFDLPQLPGPMTIHRALGYRSESPTIFLHNKNHPLAADLVVVDEASMVDLALMSKLFAALSPATRLILLGDHHQLSSVEAGSILTDICRAAAMGEGRERSYSVRGAHGSWVVQLERGFRFDPNRGIGALTRAVQAGDFSAFREVVGREAEAGESWAREIFWNPRAELNQESEFARLVLLGFKEYMGADSGEKALAALQNFRILCPHRRGREGVEALNDFCRRVLSSAGLLPGGERAGRDDLYRGRPVMVVENSYETGLFNGDLGLIWNSPEDEEQLLALFPTPGGVKKVLPATLPRHETAWAMSVHKSQGSEFTRVAVVLPRQDSPILSRELLYTAISRARSQLNLFASEEIIALAMGRKVRRHSGLAESIAEQMATVHPSRHHATLTLP